MIGSVEWDFLEKLLEEQAAFYLSGKAWSVERIEWKKKIVYVTSAPAGKVPKWGGLSPCFTGYEISRKKRDALVSTETYPYLVADAKAWLDAEVQATNEYVKVSSVAVTAAMFREVVDRMSGEGYWADAALLSKITAMMPDYRLSKFQAYLPPALQLKLVADTILDVAGVVRFLKYSVTPLCDEK